MSSNIKSINVGVYNFGQQSLYFIIKIVDIIGFI